MSQALVAIKSARVYLNDTLGISWPDAVLIPFLQEAHGELIQDLDLNSVGVIKAQTNPITVPAGTLSLPSQPSNILEPISMQERNPGEDADFFINMYKVDFLPEEDIDEDLTWWSFNQEIISFIGATRDKEVILRYKGSLTTPQVLTDPIGVIYGERFLGPRIAALAYDSIGKDSTKLSEIAERNKYKLLQRAVLGDQTPVRRKGYRSSKSFTFLRGTTSLTGPPQTGAGGTLLFADSEIPTGLMNNVNLIFSLLYNPSPPLSLELELNGVTQIQGVDYTLVGKVITFVNPPAPGDTLRAWYRHF